MKDQTHIEPAAAAPAAPAPSAEMLMQAGDVLSKSLLFALQRMYAVEAALPKAQQDPLRPVLNFTFAHVSQAGGTQDGIIQRLHLANLAYCLLLLSMAKSRLSLPETVLKAFQSRSQAWIRAG